MIRARPRSARAHPAALVAALAVAGCTEAAPPGDPFPIHATRAGGAFLTSFAADVDPDGAAARPAVIDVLSPFTVIDVEDAPPRRTGIELRLLAPPTAGAATTVTRAAFDTSALFLHPCAGAGACTVGAPGTPTSIGAVIGYDTLRQAALRFQPDHDRLYVLDEVAGDGPVRDGVCDARMPEPFGGGGSVLVGGTELSFDGLRVALDVCLLGTPAVDRTTDPEVLGTDAALVLSTGIGPSILGESRYEAWRLAHGGEPLSALPPATVLLPAGQVDGRLAAIPAMDVVGRGAWKRGPCLGAYANRLLSTRLACDPAERNDPTRCPCDGALSCPAPSVLELAPPTPIAVVVVPDLSPVLQALRAELRPGLPEIDGILGMGAFTGSVLDVDYPNGRVLFRCEPPAAGCVPDPARAPTCAVRPQLPDPASAPSVVACHQAVACEVARP